MSVPGADRLVQGLADREPALDAASPVGQRPLRDSPVLVVTLALVLVAVTGVLSLPMPFWGDQALFAVYGRQLSEGAVLYRDLFDVKQPGIFYFFALGGLLFGFTEVGIHLLELAYFLAFSVFAVLALRPYFRVRWGAAAVPVFTVAVYYLYAQVNDLTQIEILVAFPTLAAWSLLNRADAGRPRLGRYAAAGILAAVVAVLKYPYVIIILAFLAHAVLHQRQQRNQMAEVGRAVGAFSAGLFVPLLLVAAYFAAHGQLGRIWWAYFEYAPGATSLVPRDLGFLLGSTRRFVIGYAPILLLAGVGSLHVIRRRAHPQLALVLGMVVWIAIGAVLFYVQLWAEYKWLLFTVPLGILAVLGVEALASSPSVLPSRTRRTLMPALAGVSLLSFLAGSSVPAAQRWLLLAVPVGLCAGATSELLGRRSQLRGWMLQLLLAAVAVSVGLMAIAPAAKLRSLTEHDFALTTEARNDFQRAWYPPYQAADEDLEVLGRGTVLPGPLYVLGHPVLLLRADRPQAVPMLGWAYEVHDRRAWQEMHRDLRSTMPPYIVVSDHAEPVVQERYPPLMDFIASRYEVAFVGASGTWHARR